MRVDAALLSEIAGGRGRPALYPLLAEEMAARLPISRIDTIDRMSIFLAQACHETGGFQHLVELGSGDGPDADPWDDYLTRLYDQRTDLGNTPELDGDGERYRGRGIFQLTGRANYRRLGAKLGVDLERDPELAATPALAVCTAIEFWNGYDFNAPADRRDFMRITRVINGGYNGLDDRFQCWGRAWHALLRRS